MSSCVRGCDWKQVFILRLFLKLLNYSNSWLTKNFINGYDFKMNLIFIDYEKKLRRCLPSKRRKVELIRSFG